ncbi:sigma-70 family RNA polymerase sigma factor [Candidatus Dojkabacteria bacterium]|uniref:Sigma-70 family RNA polymerase sigma factor n=1 Tax=Candidatus Dojkabacteria bacterium TaxID=2099670 RepID=A0A955RK07_9BACT|nr:sigma-70 family RNA polymerase sigma factor [Candidatus Dojkabacteria bacterium]
MLQKLRNPQDLTKEEQKKIANKERLSKKDFEVIYTTYHERIFNFVNSRVTKREDAEDLTALVFERVLKKLEDFQWQGVTITSWIYRIARNAIIDFYRKNSDRKKDSSVEQIGEFLESPDEKIEEVLIENEEEIALFNSIRELEEEDQFLVYYKFFEELSNKEIADITGLSETNVGTKLHRLRQRLRGYFEGNIG